MRDALMVVAMARTDYTPALYDSGALGQGTLGPAMKALNPRQRAVVDYMITTGSTDFNAAAEAAGYMNESRNGFRVQVYRLAHDPRLSEAIIEEGKRRMAHSLPAFLRTITEIGTDKSHKDALKAALAGAAMSGVSPVTVTKHEHQHNVHVDAKAEIEAGLLQLPPDVADMLRQKLLPPTTIDVTPQMTEADAAAALADLL